MGKLDAILSFPMTLSHANRENWKRGNELKYIFSTDLNLANEIPCF